MVPEINCVIKDKDKLIESVSQISDFGNLLGTLDKFELKLNTALTKLIQDAGDLGMDYNTDEDDELSDSEDQEDQISSKKKKKN